MSSRLSCSGEILSFLKSVFMLYVIAVMMGKWSDDSVCLAVHDVRLYSVIDTVVISGDDVCCNKLFGTLVGMFMASVMWSELLITSANSCHLCSSVYECQRVECAFISPVRIECGMFVMYCMSMSAVFSAWICCLEEVYKCLQL